MGDSGKAPIMMRQRLIVMICYALALAAFGSPPVLAQMVVNIDNLPPEYEERVAAWQTDVDITTSPFHRQRFKDTYAEAIAYGDIHNIASQMIAVFDDLDWGEDEDKQQRIVNQLARFLEAMRTALSSDDIDPPLDEISEQNLFLGIMENLDNGLRSLLMEDDTDARGNDVKSYFKGTENRVLLFEFIEVDNKEMVRLLLTPEHVRQWRMLEDALTDLVSEQSKLVMAANVRDLHLATEQWDNFLNKGYSQTPWEALLNGYLIGVPEKAFGPPTHQWILAHPNIGVELSVDPLDESRVKEALHIEALGHVWYWGKKLDRFWGFSAAVSIREDFDPGIGVLVHFRRNWNLGITWHDVDEDPFLFFSVDLLQLVRQTASRYEKRYEAVKNLLEERTP
jgi:hypothetical protein